METMLDAPCNNASESENVFKKAVMLTLCWLLYLIHNQHFGGFLNLD